MQPEHLTLPCSGRCCVCRHGAWLPGLFYLLKGTLGGCRVATLRCHCALAGPLRQLPLTALQQGIVGELWRCSPSTYPALLPHYRWVQLLHYVNVSNSIRQLPSHIRLLRSSCILALLPLHLSRPGARTPGGYSKGCGNPSTSLDHSSHLHATCRSCQRPWATTG